ncbi:MAG TPA: hypothetical protein PLS06_00500 [Proteiniphilum sp.]|nr:hypothetical protein [Proteiniphilum sp.]
MAVIFFGIGTFSSPDSIHHLLEPEGIFPNIMEDHSQEGALEETIGVETADVSGPLN